MSESVCMKRVSLLFAAAVWFAALLVAGCGSTSPPAVPTTDAPVSEVARPAAPQQVTLYVAGMNQRLKIL